MRVYSQSMKQISKVTWGYLSRCCRICEMESVKETVVWPQWAACLDAAVNLHSGGRVDI